MKRQDLARGFLKVLLVVASPVLLAQQDFSKVEIVTTDLGNGIFMLAGAGGNIGVSTGDDGVFMIDDQFAPLTKKIRAALAEISEAPVKYLLNTHWHGDHTGGNENFGADGAVIVSHENVRKRLSTKQFMKAFGREVPAAPEAALPVITFDGDVTFYFNGETINVMHLPAAHTDGDSAVHFENANIVHMGDIFFNGFFPFIDQSGGGTLDGVIAAAETIAAIANDETKIIPGHGPMASKADLLTYKSMLEDVRARMAPLIGEGLSRDEVLAKNPLGDLTETWGNGFMKTEVFTGIVYDVMTET